MAQVAAVQTPYPGLRPFREDESDFFFGQDGPLSDLRDRLYADHFVAILGLSGCGKSSLLTAGLLAGIRSKRIRGNRPRWLLGYMKPGGDPLERLVETVSDVNSQLRAQLKGAVRPDVAEALLQDGYGLARYGHEAPLAHGQDILIVIDQFEELFRYQRAAATHREKDRAALFVQLLLEAARDKDCGVSVVITMRSEFLGDCAFFFGLAEQLNRGTFLLPKMTRDQIEEVITGPAEEAGFEFDPGVVQQLLNETEKQDDGLPLLQHALRRIHRHWEQRGAAGPICTEDLSSFESKPPEGTLLIKHHLDDHLDSIYRSFSDDERLAAELLFRQLSERDARERVTRRPLAFSEIVRCSGEGRRAELKAVVEAFRDEKEGRTFLTPAWPNPFEDEVIDISHECLLRRWDRLSRWIGLEQHDAEQFRRLADDADDADLQVLKLQKPRKPLDGPTLENFLKWRQDSKVVSAEWARRYEGEEYNELGRPRRQFYAAEQYLEWSAEQARARAAKARLDEEARIRSEERERRRRNALGTLVVLLAAVVVVSIWIFKLRAQAAQLSAQAAQTEQARFQAQAAAEQKLRELAEQNLRQAQANTAEQKRLRDKQAETSKKLASYIARLKAVQNELKDRNSNLEQTVLKLDGVTLDLQHTGDELKYGRYDAVKREESAEKALSAVDELERVTADMGSDAEIKQLYDIRKAAPKALSNILIPQLIVGALQTGAGEAACYAEQTHTVYSLLRSTPGLRHNNSIDNPSAGGTDLFSRRAGGFLNPIFGHRSFDPRKGDAPNARDLSNDCQTAAFGSISGDIDHYDTSALEGDYISPASPLQPHRGKVTMIRLSPDGKKLVASFERNGWAVWDLDHHRLITGNPKLNAESAAFSPDGRWMLLTEANGSISTYDLSSSLKAAVGYVAACCKTYANVRQQADIAGDGSVAWFEAESSSAHLGSYGYDHPDGSRLQSVRISPDGKFVAAGADDGSVVVWRIGEHGIVPIVLPDQSRPASPVHVLSWSPNGRYLTVLQKSGIVRVWQLNDGASGSRVKLAEDLLRRIHSEGKKEKPGDTRMFAKEVRDLLGAEQKKQ
jgi:hypothetical protein